MKYLTFLVLVLVIFSTTLFSQSRGVRVTQTNATGQSQEVQLYDGSYALIIGNSEYTNGWDRLSGVKADVAAVRNVLERHGFKVEVEENLTSDRFESRIKKFINDYGFERNNRLLIYYAGHGYTLNSAGDKRELGYIIPSDTPLPTKDERGFRQKAVDMYAINTFAKQIQAKHALFIFDSCFSGKIFALRDAPKITPFIYDKVDNPVRQFITAGNETQTVPDESIFRKAFVRGLEGEADRNGDTYITGTELADYLKESVTNYSNRRQTPQYGLINDIDLDRGDYVFTLPLLTEPVSEALSVYLLFSPRVRAKRNAERCLETSNANNSFEESLSCLDKLIESEKYKHYAFFYRASLFFARGNYTQSIADYTKAIKVSPNYLEAYKNRANAYEKIGDKAKADADRIKADELEKKIGQ